MKLVAAIILLLVSSFPVALSAQSTKPTTLAELAVYNGPDRESYMGFAYNKDKLPDRKSVV